MSKRFALFYHIWCPPQNFLASKLLIDEQIKRIFWSGIPNHVDVYCCISGAFYAEVRQYIAQYKWINVEIATEDESKFEGLTLELLHTYCQERKHLKAVGYIHTKGIRLISSPDCTDDSFKAVNSWRHLLERVTIDKWQECTHRLGQFDAAGANYRSSPWPHFGGNFWWANASYVSGLISPQVGKFPETPYDWINADDPRRKVMIERLDFERWIGLNNPDCYSLYGYPFSHLGQDLPPEFYDLYHSDIGPYLADIA